jgi:hypothetical protein
MALTVVVWSCLSEVATYTLRETNDYQYWVHKTGILQQMWQLTHHTIPAIYRQQFHKAITDNFFLYCLLKHTLPHKHVCACTHRSSPCLYLSFHGVNMQKLFLFCWVNQCAADTIHIMRPIQLKPIWRCIMDNGTARVRTIICIQAAVTLTHRLAYPICKDILGLLSKPL